MADRWTVYGNEPPRAAAGWTFEAVTPPSALAGSNGMTMGPDGRLHVTQVFGSQVTAVDIDGAGLELFSPLGGGIVGPDDAIFGADGTFYATEPFVGRVSARLHDGSHRVVRGDLPGANGITMDHQRRRLFVDEFRPGGRLLELDPAGSAPPRVLMEDLNGPNALSMGPDGRLYFPQVFANQIWAYDLDTRRAELVVDDLDVPTAVKFDSRGRIVTSEAGAGRITAIDPASARRETLAEVPRGIDNVTVGPHDRIFVSHYVDGRVAEEGGTRQRILSEPGWVGPLGVAPGPDGRLLVADALSVAAVDAGGGIERRLALLVHLHALATGVCALGQDVVVLTATGEVLRFGAGAGTPEVLAAGLEQPTDALADGPDAVLVTERGAGRLVRITRDGVTAVVASDLRSPGAVARDATGALYLTQGSGGVAVLDGAGGRREVGTFEDAQGIAVAGDAVVVADVARRALVVLDPGTGAEEVVVSNAPIGPPAPGVVPISFCSLCPDGEGGVFVGANGEGAIRRLRRR